MDDFRRDLAVEIQIEASLAYLAHRIGVPDPAGLERLVGLVATWRANAPGYPWPAPPPPPRHTPRCSTTPDRPPRRGRARPSTLSRSPHG